MYRNLRGGSSKGQWRGYRRCSLRFRLLCPLGFPGRERLLNGQKPPFEGSQTISKSEQGTAAQLFRNSLYANKGGDSENRSNDDQDDGKYGQYFHRRGWKLVTGELEHT